MMNDKSRMNREVHVRFCESLQVKPLWATRLRGWDLAVPAYSIEQTSYAIRSMYYHSNDPISLYLNNFINIW